MATNNALDFLSPDVRDIRRDREDEELQSQRIATMTPDQQNAYMAYSGGKLAGKGIGQAVGGVLGVPTGTDNERYANSVNAVKDQVAKEGIDPSDLDKFYPRVIQLLAQNRLPMEAAAMQREYQKMKLENRKADLGVKREERIERTDAAKDARSAERNEIALKALKERAPEVIRLLDAADVPGISDARRKAILDRVNQLSLGKIEWKDTGDAIVPVQGGNKLNAGLEKGTTPDAELRDAREREIADAKLDAKEGGNATDAGLKGTAKTGVQNNEGLLANIKMAYDKLKSYPNAIGFQNYGDFFDRVDRMDPKGVPVRAAVTNLGSQLIHDRSGAAVSVMEMDRLRPFVPARTDSFQAAVNKLAGMYDAAVAVTNAIREANGVPPVQYPEMPDYDPHYRQTETKPAATQRRRLTDKPAPASTDGDRVETWVRRNGKLVKE